MNSISEFILNNFQSNSPSAVIVRAIVWLALVSIFAIGVGTHKTANRIKTEAGIFLFVIIFIATAIYFIFGFIPTLTSLSSE